MILNTRVFFQSGTGAPILGLVGGTVQIKEVATNTVVANGSLTEDAGGVYFYDFTTEYDPKESYQAYFDSGTGLFAVQVYAGYQDLISEIQRQLANSSRGGGGGGAGFWNKEVYLKFLKDIRGVLDDSFSNIEMELPEGWDESLTLAVSEMKSTMSNIELSLEQHGADYVDESNELRKAILKSVKGIVDKLETPVVNVPEIDLSVVVEDVSKMVAENNSEMFGHLFDGMKEIMKHSLTDKEKKKLEKKFKEGLDGIFDKPKE